MDDLTLRILALQRLLNEILTRVVAIEQRSAVAEQQNANRWYQAS